VSPRETAQNGFCKAKARTTFQTSGTGHFWELHILTTVVTNGNLSKKGVHRQHGSKTPWARDEEIGSSPHRIVNSRDWVAGCSNISVNCLSPAQVPLKFFGGGQGDFFQSSKGQT